MSDNMQQASPWEAIDGIVLINLDRHADRWERFRREVGSRLPSGRLHRLSAVEGVGLPGFGVPPWFTDRTGARARFWGGTAGCALSHRRALELAREKQWRHVLILEDDATMGELTAAYGRVLSRALQQLRGPYMLYLGYNRPRPYGRCLGADDGVSLWKIQGVLATHAYLVPAELYDLLLERLPREANVWEWLSINRAVDVFYREIVSNSLGVPTYSIEPQLFRQGGFASSITSGEADDCRCIEEPRPLGSLPGLCYRLFSPLRRMKVRLNALRTYCRARSGGLPGYRKDRT